MLQIFGELIPQVPLATPIEIIILLNSQISKNKTNMQEQSKKKSHRRYLLNHTTA